jgi:hypothetical protein
VVIETGKPRRELPPGFEQAFERVYNVTHEFHIPGGPIVKAELAPDVSVDDVKQRIAAFGTINQMVKKQFAVPAQVWILVAPVNKKPQAKFHEDGAHLSLGLRTSSLESEKGSFAIFPHEYGHAVIQPALDKLSPAPTPKAAIDDSELFADLMTVLALNNGQAVPDAIGPVDQPLSPTVQARDFTQLHRADSAPKANSYAVSAPVRSFIWLTYAGSDPSLDRAGLIAQGLMQAALADLQAVAARQPPLPEGYPSSADFTAAMIPRLQDIYGRAGLTLPPPETVKLLLGGQPSR